MTHECEDIRCLHESHFEEIKPERKAVNRDELRRFALAAKDEHNRQPVLTFCPSCAHARQPCDAHRLAEAVLELLPLTISDDEAHEEEVASQLDEGTGPMFEARHWRALLDEGRTDG